MTRVRLGTFDVAEDATMAYDMATYKLRGEFVQLNFPHLKHKFHMAGHGSPCPTNHLPPGSQVESSSSAPRESKRTDEADLLQTVGSEHSRSAKKLRMAEDGNQPSNCWAVTKMIKKEVEIRDMASMEEIDEVLLSRLPSLDMDNIWDSFHPFLTCPTLLPYLFANGD